MDDDEKAELRRIIRKIPSHIKSHHHIAKIHRNYAPDFSYGTFRKYWQALRTT